MKIRILLALAFFSVATLGLLAPLVTAADSKPNPDYRALSRPLPETSAPRSSQYQQAYGWRIRRDTTSSPADLGVSLQRLVRYFQNSRPTAGEGTAAVTFRLPVDETKVSKISEPSPKTR